MIYMKIAYALGGGGARGIAHVGVLKAFEEANLKPDMIVGTSMGSIIGAMYAQYGSSVKIEEKLKAFIESKEYKDLDLKYMRRSDSGGSFFGNIARQIEERIVINLSASQKAIFKQESFTDALEFLLQPGVIEKLTIPFLAIASDLLTGQKVVLSQGDIRTAVLASSSIPGFLPPVTYRGWELVDGEVSDLVPCTTARETGADFIIAVDVSQGLLPPPDLDNAFDIIFRAGHIKSYDLIQLRMKNADFIVRPEVGGFHWTKFNEQEVLIEEGYRAGKSAISEIKRKLRYRKFKFWK